MAEFKWTKKKEQAAFALADGHTREEAAAIAGIGERTIYRLLNEPEFAEEVDRLTFMTGVATKAERLRMTKRMVRQLGTYTEKDLLDWLKYAQGETDGIRLDLADLLTAISSDGDEVADG